MKPVGCWSYTWNSFSKVWGQVGQSHVCIDFDTWEKGMQMEKRNSRIWLTLEVVKKWMCESGRKVPRIVDMVLAVAVTLVCSFGLTNSAALLRGLRLWILGRKCRTASFSLPLHPTPFPAYYSLCGFKPEWTGQHRVIIYYCPGLLLPSCYSYNSWESQLWV